MQIYKRPGGRVVSSPDQVLKSQVQMTLEMEFNSWQYGASLNRAFHYHPPSSRNGLNNVEKDANC